MKLLSWFKYLACLVLFLSIALFYRNNIAFPSAPINSSSNENPMELRGVWLTNVASGVLFAPGSLERSLTMLSQLNFNTVYPVVWNRGLTLYPSEVSKKLTGTEQVPLLTLMGGGEDVLAKTVKAGKEQDLKVIPWFEYGLMTPANSSLAKLHPEWLTQNGDGEYSISDQPELKSQVWLNPLKPEVRQFLKDLVIEVVSNYDVDGIQFDDHFGLPVEFGYDSTTVWSYRQEHQGSFPPIDYYNQEWMKWRANKLTQLWQEIAESARKVKPDLRISLATNPYQFAYRNYLQDWQTWVARGWVDELILQVYREDLNSFVGELSAEAVKLARSKTPASIGIFTGNLNNPVGIERIEKQVEAVRDYGFNGVSFFYWESLWSYLTPDSPRKRRHTFQTLFPEPALVPKFSTY